VVQSVLGSVASRAAVTAELAGFTSASTRIHGGMSRSEITVAGRNVCGRTANWASAMTVSSRGRAAGAEGQRQHQDRRRLQQRRQGRLAEPDEDERSGVERRRQEAREHALLELAHRLGTLPAAVRSRGRRSSLLFE
jgi:hypothetical protein